MKTIAEKYKKLTDKLVRIGAKMKQLRETCTHEGVYYSYGASTGNYDPSCNSYWVDWQCPHCGKQWTTEQNTESNNDILRLKAEKL